jgi:di/tricarboxylate transporter
VIVLGLTCAATVFWEFAEFLSDRYLGTHAQGALDDTLSDMLFGILGGTAFAAITGVRRSQAQLPAPSNERQQ